MIDPNVVTTARVGELPSNPISLTDKIPHEIGTELNQSTVQQLADLIGDYLGTTSSLAFNPTTVADGQTLPVTTSNEWMLVGKGTFQNVGGGMAITTTEELNAITSNGSFWSLAVEIPINVELSGITQNIRSGYTQTTPSENAVYLALQDIINSIPTIPVVLKVPKIYFIANGTDNTFDIGVAAEIVLVLIDNAPILDSLWDQTGTTFTLNFIPDSGSIIKPI